MKVLIVVAALLWPPALLAQAFPAKPARIVNPFAPGGATDMKELGAFNRAELVKWAKIVKHSGAKLD